MKRKILKEQIPFSKYFIQKEGLFKNKKKIINLYKEGILITNFEETEKEEIYYEDIINITSEENSKDFTIHLKDNVLVSKENNNQLSTITYSLANSQTICSILSELI